MSIDDDLRGAVDRFDSAELRTPAFEAVTRRRRTAERVATVVASVLLLGGSVAAWNLGSSRGESEPSSDPGPCNELLLPEEVPSELSSPTFSDPQPAKAPRTVHCIWHTSDGGNGLGLHILEFDTPAAAQQYLADDAARFPARVDVPNGFTATTNDAAGGTVTTAGWVEGTAVLLSDGSIPAITPQDDLRFVQLAASRLAVLRP